MLNTLKWMTDAREGGYKFQHYICDHCEELMMSCDKVEVEKALLDPKAWQAVGKTRGWGDMHDYPDNVYEAWDTFFYQLYNGDSVEEALSAITN